MDEQRVIDNNKEEVPFRHYCDLFRKLDPADAVARCGVTFENNEFCVRLLDTEYFIAWPEFAIRTASGEGLALDKLPFQTYLMPRIYPEKMGLMPVVRIPVLPIVVPLLYCPVLACPVTSQTWKNFGYLLCKLTVIHHFCSSESIGETFTDNCDVCCRSI